MRWFKHLSRAHLDEKMTALIDECGLEGYGFYWMLLEVVAESMDNTGRCDLTHPLPQWSRLLYSHHNRVSKYLGKLQVMGMVTVESVEGKVRVTIPNMLKYRDEYSKKSGECPEDVRSKIESQKQIQNQSQKNTNTNACAPGETKNLPFDGVDAPPEKTVCSVTVKHSEAVREKWFREGFWPIVWAKIGVEFAKKSWIKHVETEADRDKIIEAAIRQGPILLQQARDRGGAVLHPSTWINQGRYDDDVAALAVYSAPRSPPSKADRTAELFSERMAMRVAEGGKLQ